MDTLRESYKSKVAAGSVYPGSRIKAFQRIFQQTDGQPVFLKSKTDVRLYRGVMGLSVLGIGITLFSIYRMATGQIHKKE